MQAILVSNEELAQLRALVQQQGENHRLLRLALGHPVPNLAEFLPHLDELINRARDGSRYIDEDFPELLKALELCALALARRDEDLS